MEIHKRISKTTTIQDIFDMTDEPKEIALNDLKALWKDMEPEGLQSKLLTDQHQKRTDKVDLEFPILVATKNGRYVQIIDGHHRIMKARQENLSVIKVRVLNLDGFDAENLRLARKLVKILYWHWSNNNNYDTHYMNY